MIFNLLKNIINSGDHEREDMKDKLDIFLVFDRITIEQYEELTDLMK